MENSSSIVARDIKWCFLQAADLHKPDVVDKVRFLALQDQPPLTSNDLKLLEKRPLDGLSVSINEVTDEGLSPIGNVGTLRLLELLSLPQISSFALARILSSLKGLEELTILWCFALDDAVFSALDVDRSSLRGIYLSGFKSLTDSTLRRFGQMPRLRALTLPPAFAYTRSFEPVTTSFTDAGVTELSRSRSIETLNLRGLDQSSVSSLNALANLKSLRILRIADCARITPEDLLDFAKQRRECKVYSSSYALAEPLA